MYIHVYTFRDITNTLDYEDDDKILTEVVMESEEAKKIEDNNKKVDEKPEQLPSVEKPEDKIHEENEKENLKEKEPFRDSPFLWISSLGSDVKANDIRCTFSDSGHIERPVKNIKGTFETFFFGIL